MTRERDNSGMLSVLQEVSEREPDRLKGIMRIIIEQLLEEEITAFLGAQPHERTEERIGYRNGYKPRTLKTRVGKFELLVPKDREGRFQTSMFERYQRSEKALVLGIVEMYVQGVSTRNVKAITEALCGIDISKSQVSELAKRLDEEMREWRNRPLEKGYPYLVIDARYEKVRSGGRVVSSGVLIVTGIREDGVREILGVWVMPLESEATWSEVFKELKDRGLRDVIYTVSDDHKGLVAAIEKYFPEALWQRCQVHFMRNVLGKIRKADRKEVVNLLHGITEAATKEGALRGAKEAVERLAEDYPKAAEMIEENAEDILAVYELPESHRKKMRTTNMMERLNQELKRRTRVVRIFPSDGSCLRLTCALAMETSEEWEERRYLDMSELEEAGLAEAAREAVA